MDQVHNSLIAAGFSRTSLDISFPLVVHGVPGCGKTTFLTSLLSSFDFHIQTYGVVRPSNLAGRGICKALTPLKAGFNFLDEYLSGDVPSGFDLLISDPYQNHRQPLPAHYTKTTTHRFGKSVCGLLQKLGFEIVSEREEDTEVVFGTLFGTILRGKIICFEKPVIDLLNSHSAEFSHPCDLRGAEFEEVSFLTASSDLQSIVCSDLYIALTRATKRLNILLNK